MIYQIFLTVSLSLVLKGFISKGVESFIYLVYGVLPFVALLCDFQAVGISYVTAVVSFTLLLITAHKQLNQNDLYALLIVCITGITGALFSLLPFTIGSVFY